MTPHLKAWKDDAEEFGFSPETQKGLIFLVALDLSANPDLENIEEHKEKMFLLSDHVRDPNTSVGGEFYDGPIMDILFELAELTKMEVSPRTIFTKHTGEPITIQGDNRGLLPDFDIDHSTYADFDRLKTALCEEIGKHINEDLEGAYIAGHKFFASYYNMDRETTVKICRVPFALNVPKFTWYKHMLDHAIEHLGRGCPIQKTLTCFLGSNAIEGRNAVCIVANEFHYDKQGDRRDEVWGMTIEEYLEFAVQNTFTQLNLENNEWPDLFHTARTQFQEYGFKQGYGLSLSDGVQQVRMKIQDTFGYELKQPDPRKPFAEEIMLRCMITYVSTGYALCR